MTSPLPPNPSQPALPSETTALMLATLADLYRQELGAEEDVPRTLPFFGTALGIVIAALAYAAGRLPRWIDLTTQAGLATFTAATILLAWAIVEAACVIIFISRAIGRRAYQRIGPEVALVARLSDLQSYYAAQGTTGKNADAALAEDMRQALIKSYADMTPSNRELNERRYTSRARASSHLLRSLILALAATTVIFMSDKLGYLPMVKP